MYRRVDESYMITRKEQSTDYLNVMYIRSAIKKLSLYMQNHGVQMGLLNISPSRTALSPLDKRLTGRWLPFFFLQHSQRESINSQSQARRYIRSESDYYYNKR